MPARKAPRPGPLRVQGSLWVSAGEQPLGGHGRMALLRAVAAQGSITQAARAFGMSYKAAWDAIDAMNAAAGAPLVERVAGGRGGGGTRLTERGQRLLQRYEQLDAVHQRFVRLLADRAMDLDRDFSLLEVLNVKTSARNQWVGTVGAIRAGAVSDEVELRLPGPVRLVAIVTRESTDALGLRLQQTVIAMVKASAVLLATGLDAARVSARNRLDGHVVAVRPGAVNAEVTLEAAGGLPVVAIAPQAAVHELGLAPGAPVTALVQASDVVLAVVD
ncbi:MAG: TOBE domain-containing protein [Rubrivivax sp.]